MPEIGKAIFSSGDGCEDLAGEEERNVTLTSLVADTRVPPVSGWEREKKRARWSALRGLDAGKKWAWPRKEGGAGSG